MDLNSESTLVNKTSMKADFYYLSVAIFISFLLSYSVAPDNAVSFRK